MRLQSCAELPPQTSLTDVARVATTRAFSKPAAPTPEEMFDDLCRLAGVPTIAEDLAGAQEGLIAGIVQSWRLDLLATASAAARSEAQGAPGL